MQCLCIIYSKIKNTKEVATNKDKEKGEDKVILPNYFDLKRKHGHTGFRRNFFLLLLWFGF